MAKSSKPKKKAAAKASPAKKAKPAKTAKKKAAPKKKAVKKSAERAAPGEPAVILGNCFCLERDGLFFCMKRMPNGSFKECPALAAFETLEECQMNSC